MLNAKMHFRRGHETVNDGSSVCLCMCLNEKRLNDASMLDINSQVIFRINAEAERKSQITKHHSHDDMNVNWSLLALNDWQLLLCLGTEF